MSRLTVAAARRHIAAQCLTAADPRACVGLEVELLAFAADDPMGRPDAGFLAGLHLPGGSRVTFEPGGQVELSGPPCPDVAGVVAAMAADLAAVRAAAAVFGVELVAVGFDDARPPRRLVRSPRYDAMEAYFDHDGEAGRWMMCNTAALQVNVDLGSPRRWRRAHAIGPVLAAAFANSPGPGGTRSRRLANWWDIDPSRTAPCRGEWADYVLDARVMMVDHAPVVTPLTFAQWIDTGRAGVDHLDHHLTTLFPPVRPRGWLELRFLDALPEPWWPVAVAVTVALVGGDIGESDLGVGDLWREAAQHGLSHPALAQAALRGFAVALEALPDVGASPETAAAAAEYFERYVSRGRCPADDAPATVR